ncbi:hypothetical protein BVC80_495g12 [Macleaya cordata]|uniref:RNase H type-1 domain-containing protein n=1 Tax=Macleaya cordata TaxID=56857 RepID=A0A200Q8U4_MACCD|nr:hypothetical protein BVC80_495g12 [Macleaya cordata]
MSIRFGICTNFVAEILAIILGMEWAFDQGWSNVWIASDSMAAIRCFTANKIPWFIHTMSKRGTSLQLGCRDFFDYKPSFLSVENPDTVYYRFS